MFAACVPKITNLDMTCIPVLQRAKSILDPTINAVARYGSLLLRRPYP